VALIKLKTPIPNPKVITIADPAADKKFVKEGVKLTATGWARCGVRSTRTSAR
jgi:hypothetical protein